ncbi:MAG: pantoate--beta-alanine ligase [Deltaproteobacteria bacterium]|nr:pantoate--beta-alanine ligase [Candidatus Anaeroferrophillacea bacterium]
MNPKIIHDPEAMQHWSLTERAAGRILGLVPTMGYLHRGHLSLMETLRPQVDRLVVSIFVNPIQFGAGEDLDRYPRDWDGDLAACRNAGVDVIFAPEPAAVYPAEFQTAVSVARLTAGLCGALRPGHFDGVTTVVAKLFNLTLPHRACFGEKDYQQLAVIRRMVADLAFPVEIVAAPIVREDDGLALSSRNVYLSAADRHAALGLSRGLFAARKRYAAGERRAVELAGTAHRTIVDHAGDACALEYLVVCDARSLEEIVTVDRETVIALAAKVGRTRLIDNIILAANPEATGKNP